MVEVIDSKSKELAIEFAEWLHSECENGYFDEVSLWAYLENDNLYTTKQLFTKFLEDKYNDRG